MDAQPDLVSLYGGSINSVILEKCHETRSVGLLVKALGEHSYDKTANNQSVSAPLCCIIGLRL